MHLVAPRTRRIPAPALYKLHAVHMTVGAFPTFQVSSFILWPSPGSDINFPLFLPPNELLSVMNLGSLYNWQITVVLFSKQENQFKYEGV